MGKDIDVGSPFIMEHITGFKPIANQSATILILGSMPSEASLLKRQYYAHPRNQFWLIIARVFSKDIQMSYRAKTTLLKESGIALWDVIASCKRKGSLDAHIKEVSVNDIPKLLKRYKNIRAIFCNGKTAFNMFEKKFKSIGLPVVCLPSTSPANTQPIEWKLKQWNRITLNSSA